MRAILSKLLTLFGFGGNTQTSPVQRVDPATINPGPIQHEVLSREQLERIARVHRAFSDVDSSPLEKWIDNFKRDANPDREIAIWERMASAYSEYCSRRNLSVDAKQDVYRAVVARSVIVGELNVNSLKLKVLTPEEVGDLMKLF